MKSYYESRVRAGELWVEARDWIGTPFHPQGKLKHVGVDCVQLVAAIYRATGFVDEFDPGEYAMDSGQHLESSKVLSYVERTQRFKQVWTAESAAPIEMMLGDLLCFTIGRVVHHVGLATDQNTFIHTYRRHPVRPALVRDTTWKSRLHSIYRPRAL